METVELIVILAAVVLYGAIIVISRLSDRREAMRRMEEGEAEWRRSRGHDASA